MEGKVGLLGLGCAGGRLGWLVGPGEAEHFNSYSARLPRGGFA